MKIILIDGTGLVYRSFYAVPPFLKDANGEPTNAVLGFTNILLSLLEVQRPDYVAVAFDLRGPTFRHEQYKEYKATRVKAPQELYDQIPKAREVVRAFNIPMLEKQGFEADDVIATLVKKFESEKDAEIFIATGDFDMFQCVNERVKILYPTKGFRAAEVFSEEAVMKKYGIRPDQVTDYKGLAGDSSDNIPGVKGVGEKTATSLLEQYGNLEGIYGNLEKISSPALRKKLETDKEMAFFSRKLATLDSAVPLEITFEQCRVQTLDFRTIAPLFVSFGFKNLLGRLGMEIPADLAVPAQPSDRAQVSFPRSSKTHAESQQSLF